MEDLSGADATAEDAEAEPADLAEAGSGDGLEDADTAAQDADGIAEDTLGDDDAPGPPDPGPDAAPDGEELDAGPDVEVGCEEGGPCMLPGYVPACYEGRCNARGTCMPARIADCCLTDDDCAPRDLGACDVVRCVQNRCAALHTPGCCGSLTPDGGCDDGIDATLDTCDELASRCSSCAPPCPGRSPLFAATFDDARADEGLAIVDGQPGDAVTWQRVTDVFAAGGGALYLGNPRCRTYYGGALDAACQPVQTGEQDSARVNVALITPWVALPADSPAVMTAWVRAHVEPRSNLGAAEPDVLRVLVEPASLGITWRVASTIDLGKSTDWAPIAVDLLPWRGQTIRVRFEFDTLDGENNRFEGVWLDEITLGEACAQGGCCSDDTLCAAPGACTRGACLTTSEGGSRLCAEVPVTPGALCTPCADDAACADTDPCTHDLCLPSGACGHEVFCCLERDLFAEDFAASLGAMTSSDSVPDDGVAWQWSDGAAWFGNADTGHYGAAGPVSGEIVSPLVALPEALPERAHATLALTLRLSTEWDLADTPPTTALDNPAGLDRLVIAVEDAGFSSTLWTSDAIGGTTYGQPLELGLDLERWRGRSIRVHLQFDSGDATLNDFAGAFIDAIAVGLRCD